MPTVIYGPEICRNLEAATRLEWLETNGLGGYASSTVTGLNTRRYHGAFVGATTPPTGRLVLINKIDETVILGGVKYLLGANRFPGAIHPMGHLLLEEFRVDPLPRWIYRIGDYFFEKTLFMVHERNTTVVRYRWVDRKLHAVEGETAPRASLRVRMYVSFRDYHHLAKKNAELNTDYADENATFVIKPYADSPVVTVNHEGFVFEPAADWYYNFQYEAEMRRGLDYHEDLYSYGEFVCPAFQGPASLMASIGKSMGRHEGHRPASSLEKIVDMLVDKEITRRARFLRGFEKSSETARKLVLATDQFVVERGREQFSVIAGYPWFADWGRDTMISMPGLTLQTKRYELARRILETFASYCKYGLIPNNFPDRGVEPNYNSIDATLWFFIAAHDYERAACDTDFIIGTMFPVFQKIIANLRKGTLYDIRVEDDGLLAAGNEHTQLTWMDACVDGKPITPRHGKCVEINALWYNALRIAADAASKAGAQPDHYLELAEKARISFEEKFWNADAGCLYDLIGPHGPDPSVRPNQALALSLPHQLLKGNKAESVLKVIESELLTPYGLRSLSPKDAAYRGICSGDVVERDGAYHQGTVWGWLLGPYVRAVLNVRGRNKAVLSALSGLVPAMEKHLGQAGINSVSEIFDGDAPHEPRGCIAQAWSVAEWLCAINLITNGPQDACPI